MANRYFAGNTLAAFFRSSTAAVEATTAAGFDSAYVPNCISIPAATGAYIETAPWSATATGTLYGHFEAYNATGSISGSNEPLLLCLNGSTNVFRLAPVAGALQPQYWNGSAWTNTGATIPLTTGVRYRFDVKIVLGSSFEVSLSGAVVSSGSGWTGGGTSVTRSRFGTYFSSSPTLLSQVMFADYDLRDSKYMLAGLNGDSASNTNGTGAYTTINETVLDESTGVSLTTTAHKRGQTHAAITVPAGYVIGAAVWNARGRVNGTITDGKLGFRSGGTNYSSSGKTYNGGYEPRGHIIENDPATATRFTQSGFNAAETYLEAV